MKGIMNWFTNKLTPGMQKVFNPWHCSSEAQCRKSCRLFW